MKAMLNAKLSSLKDKIVGSKKEQKEKEVDDLKDKKKKKNAK